MRVLVACVILCAVADAKSPAIDSKAITEAHNRLRAKHCAPPLTWSEKVAASARKWAETLRQKGCGLVHSGGDYGENLAAGEAYGAQQPDPVLRPDIRPETAAQLDMYMEALARTDSPVDQALKAINLDLQQRGATPKETEQVFSELLQRSKQGMTGQGRWFDGLDFPMRDPVEVAQALGSPVLRRMSEGEGRG